MPGDPTAIPQPYHILLNNLLRSEVFKKAYDLLYDLQKVWWSYMSWSLCYGGIALENSVFQGSVKCDPATVLYFS